jgi:NADH:ubiquinone oxidoreductase subunit E
MHSQKCQCNGESGYFERLTGILEKYTRDESNLIPILQNIQEVYGYLPIDILDKMCELTGMSPSQVMGVATFYSQFRLKAAGENIIKLCFGTACHVNGAERIATVITDELNIEIGETTTDNKFSLETVACLGCCSLAPVMMIGNETFGRLTPDKTRKILRSYQKEDKSNG